MQVWEEGSYRIALYLPLQLAVNLKLFFKKIQKERKTKRAGKEGRKEGRPYLVADCEKLNEFMYVNLSLMTYLYAWYIIRAQ